MVSVRQVICTGLVLIGTVEGTDISRYCYESPIFTGYKFQLEVATSLLTYSLVYCNDNKLIYKTSVTDLNQNFTMGNDQISILKHSRTLLPNKHVGSLLINGRFLSPLMSDNFLKSWIEINGLQRIVHVPILRTPKVDDKLYSLISLETKHTTI